MERQDESAKAVLRRVAGRVFFGPVLDYGAQLAFYAVLSLVPFLVVLTSVAAFVPSADTVQRLLARAQTVMPEEAYRLVARVVGDVVEGRSATLFTLGLFTALWSASRAANALRKGLNAAHGVDDGRSWARRQVVAIAFTVGGAALLVSSVSATLVGGRAVEAVAGALGVGVAQEVQAWGLVRWPLAVLSVGALAALCFRVLPDLRPRPRAVAWGALVATGLFLASGLGLSFYTRHFARYGLTYGSLAGGVVLLLWAWLSAIAFLVGGEVTACFPGARPRR
ncbi:MAG: YihY/virulence factor BrkB family protein [Myxococcales bacterium]|nr:YihY/virulence factor BrkB family protein [Myxococcales bacterium]